MQQAVADRCLRLPAAPYHPFQPPLPSPCSIRPRGNRSRRQCAAAAAACGVGIDLGTTNSAVAIFRPGASRPTMVPDAGGHLTVPSVVAVTADRRVLVGREALGAGGLQPLLHLFQHEAADWEGL